MDERTVGIEGRSLVVFRLFLIVAPILSFSLSYLSFKATIAL